MWLSSVFVDAGSGTRMCRFVDGPQSLAGQMGVDLGRRQIRMTEQLLHGPQVGSAFQQVRSVRVPEGVRVQGPPVGQRVTLDDAMGVPRTQPPAPSVEEHRTRGRIGCFELGTALAEP